MDAQIKAKWVEALRSGKYKQGKDALRPSQRTYCCLGVLCRIEGAKWNNISAHRPWMFEADFKGDTDVTNLPRALAGQLGIEPKQEGHLVAMNDSGAPFSEIADFIEQNL